MEKSRGRNHERMRFVTRDVTSRFKQCYFEDSLIAAPEIRINALLVHSIDALGPVGSAEMASFCVLDHFWGRFLWFITNEQNTDKTESKQVRAPWAR